MEFPNTRSGAEESHRAQRARLDVHGNIPAADRCPHREFPAPIRLWRGRYRHCYTPTPPAHCVWANSARLPGVRLAWSSVEPGFAGDIQFPKARGDPDSRNEDEMEQEAGKITRWRA